MSDLNKINNTDKELAIRVLSNSNESQKAALGEWAKGLLAIKHSNMGTFVKGQTAIKFTAQSKVIIPILKILAKEIKIDQLNLSKAKTSSKTSVLKSMKAFWANRSLPTKMGLGASSVALIVFGTQGAGIAALGTAIGVPLWVVFGAGATFAGVLYEEVTGKKFDAKTIDMSARKSFLGKLSSALSAGIKEMKK